MDKNTKQENFKGITLIALVITIIVLLILAGVSISMLTGDNGILSQATNAREQTEKASELEGIQLAVLGSETKNNGYLDILDETTFKKELEKHFENEKLDVHSNGDGSFIVTINDRKYYVNDDKTVIDSDNVIEIGTKEQLEAFRDDVNSGNSYEGKVVLLTSDITLDSSIEWEPIGIYVEGAKDDYYYDLDKEVLNKTFKGVFDGCNHKIDNFKLNNQEKCQGLFGLVIDGSIRNVVIGENSSIIAGNRTGAVVGQLFGLSGNIYNCINYANVTVNGIATGGGIVGSLTGQHIVSNCKNYGSITAQEAVGGIVGSSNGGGENAKPEEFLNYSHKIINCGNYGDITEQGENSCGGIVGYLHGNILNCTNKGKIKNEYRRKDTTFTGGIVGCIDGKVESCYNIGDVTGMKNCGGILGVFNSLGGSIVNCYSLGKVSGEENIGYIIGDIDRVSTEITKIINCYTKDNTFTAEDLGEAFKDDEENINNGYPILDWE